jgi:pilus assembly protein Flp/PilA
VRLARDQRGASAIEYIIVVGLIAIVAIAGFKKFGIAADKKIGEERGALENLKVDGTGATP